MSELTTSAIRTPLDNFPDVIIHAPETAVKKHPRYKDAKAGDSDAAIELVQKTIQCCPYMVSPLFARFFHCVTRDRIASVYSASW
jgi:hypothetical protein